MQDGGPPRKSKGRTLAGPVPGDGVGHAEGDGFGAGPRARPLPAPSLLSRSHTRS